MGPVSVGPAISAPPDHVVQCYARERELIPSVASYLADAIRGGGTAVMIAEPAHTTELAWALEQRGIDLRAARRDGALVECDAAATLRLLQRSDGELDAARFEAVIGRLLGTAAGRGGPVRAYGEMVALLWERGACGRALELEGLWNQLGQRIPFGLYCGYRIADPQDASEALWQVGALHTAVHGPQLPAALTDPARPFDVVQSYEPEPTSPAAARALARDLLHRWGQQQVVEAAMLVLSELANNAVLHARTGFQLRLSPMPDRLQITVSDTSAELPVPQPPNPRERSGRGLQVVHTLTGGRWGAAPDGPGKHVWAELPLNRAAGHTQP